MKRLITLLFAFSFVYSASAVTYYSKGNLNANLVASWSATTDGIGASPTNFTTGDIFIIQASHLMTTSATLSISGTASKLQISNTATLTATFAITLAAATTFQIDNGGTYVHNHAATMSTILGGTESFGVTSTVKISSFSGTGALSTSLTASVASGGNNYFFGNLIIDWASLAASTTWSQAYSSGTVYFVANNLSFTALGSAATSKFRFISSGTPTVVIGGNLSIGTISGTVDVNGGTGAGILQVASYTQTGGILDVSQSSGNTLFKVSDAFNQSAGTITESGSSSSGAIEFNGAAAQVPIIAGTVSNQVNYTINNAAGVTAVLTLNSAAKLTMTAGVLTGKPSYFGSASTPSVLIYTATSGNITAGDEILGTPSSGAPNLRVLGTANLTCSDNITINIFDALTSNTAFVTMAAGKTLFAGNDAYPSAGLSTSSSNVNLAAAGSGIEAVYSNVSSSRTFPVAWGATASDIRRVAFTSFTTSAIGTHIRLELKNDATGTLGAGLSIFGSDRRYVFTASSGTFTSFGSMTISNTLASAVDYPTGTVLAKMRLANAPTVVGGHTLVGTSANYSSNGATSVGATSLSTNYTSLGSFAIAVDVPKTFTATSGSWGDAANWSGSTIPTATDNIDIASGKTITLDGSLAAPYLCNELVNAGTITAVNGNALNIGGTVSSSGTINLPVGGQINIGANCGDNKVFTNTGALNITGGILVVNGQYSQNTGGSFTMSSGELIADPNGGTAATSMQSSVNTIYLNVGTATITGGTISVNDPAFSGGGSAIGYYLASNNYPNLTIKLGGTVGNSGATCPNSTISSSNGLPIYASNAFLFGTLNIAGPAATHFVSISSSSATLMPYVANDLIIPSTGELRIVNTSYLGVGGNIVNDGILTTNGVIKFETLNGSNVITSPAAAQTISGSGTYRNFSSTPTGEMGAFVINNINGVTLGAGIPASFRMGTGFGTISALALTSGRLFIGATDISFVSGSPVLSGGSATSYIVTNSIGKLFRVGTGALVFPIGSTVSSYDPVTITPASSATFAVLAKNSITNSVSLGYSNKVVNREWDITRTGTASSTTLAFTPDAAARDANNTPAGSAGIAGHWNGSTWDNNIATTYASGTWTVTGYTGSFSPFIVAASGAVLTVDFTAISATNKGTTNNITFATADEKDLTVFQIERSATGTEGWSNIGELKAKGASIYTFVDANPLTVSYYRVRGVELSGKSIVSKIVSVNTGKAKLAVLNVYPSPTKNNVTIDFDAVANSNVTVSIKDITGRLVLTKNVKGTEGSHNLTLDVSNLSNGVYIVSINDNVSSIVKRIVKN